MLHLKDVFSSTERTVITIFSLIAILTLSALVYDTYMSEELLIKPGVDVYTEVFNKEIGPLNPLFVAADSPEDDVSSFIYSSLIKHDPYRDIFVGDLASSWSLNSDGDIYTFVLRDDVFWHDGQRLTIEDIIYTIWLIKDQRLLTRWGDTFKNVRVTRVDDNRVQFKLKYSDTFFIENFTFPILPKHLLSEMHVYDLMASNFNKQPIGSGMYSIQSVITRKKSTQVNLIANKNYYGSSPIVDSLSFQFISDKKLYDKTVSTSKAIFEQRESMNKEVAGDYIEYALPTSQFHTLFFNSESEIIKNSIVRQAIYKYLSSDISFKKTVENSVIKNNLFEIIEDSESNDENPKELLYGVGWQTYTKEFTDGIRRNIRKEKLAIKLVTINKEPYMSIAKELALSLRDLGIEVLYAGFSENEISYEFLREKNYDMLLVGLKINNSDDLFSYLHSTQTHKNGGLNLSQYKNLEVDLLLEDLRTSTDLDYKEKVKKEIIKRLDIDVPFIFLSQKYSLLKMNKQIEGFVIPSEMLDSKDRYYNFEKIDITEN